MSIREVRNEIISDLTENLSDLTEVKSFGGQFDFVSLKQFSTKAPAAKLSWLGFNKLEKAANGQFKGPCRWGLFLVTKNKPKAPAEDQMIDLIERAIERIEGQQWGLDYTEPATVSKIENLYSMDTNMNGIGLGGIIIEQTFTFGTDLHEEDDKENLGYGVLSLDEIIGTDVVNDDDYSSTTDHPPDDLLGD